MSGDYVPYTTRPRTWEIPRAPAGAKSPAPLTLVQDKRIFGNALFSHCVFVLVVVLYEYVR